MNDFFIYLQLGFEHITDPRGYDHILFVIALCAVFTPQQWRQVLILITAFTIVHSITLALATLQIIHYKTDLIELLIPVTILITAITNFFFRDSDTKRYRTKTSPKRSWRYGIALVFGLIHGMGFSNYLRSLLGQEADIVTPLLAFNIGLEIGQLVIVGLVMALAYVILNIARKGRLHWVLIISGMVAGMALSLIINNEYLSNLLK